ncbi:GntR family transcriptional regulator [Siminovitchia sp. FSL H7-0308]|uniref:GntR family transcriptional regulator n=1 Tax=unclassified Siminovitchia TaxID=2837530 RepID=UPI0030CEF6B2
MRIKKALHQQIYDDLVSKILSGTYKVGEQLPSESELDKLYNASRSPVRQALAKLESDGYIYRFQGKGSFVASRTVSEAWTRMTGFKLNYLEQEGHLSAKVLSIDQVTNAEIAQLYHVEASRLLTQVNRVIYIDQKPIIYIHHYPDPNIPIKVFEENDDFVVLGEMLKEKMDIEIKEVEEEVEPFITDEEVGKHLDIKIGEPILKITRISSDTDSNPIDINTHYVNTNIWKYKVNFR